MDNDNKATYSNYVFTAVDMKRAEQYVAALVQMQDTDSVQKSLSNILAMEEDAFNMVLADLRWKRCIVWDVSDVQGALEDECPRLSDEDALRILEYAVDHHGADTGVTWETFCSAAEAIGHPIVVH